MTETNPTGATDATPPPPDAPRRPHQWSRPTGAVEDPYAWMRDTDDPELHAYLAAENEFADRWFDRHTDTIDAIYREIRSRVQETDMSVPVAHGDWWYVSRTVEGLHYPIHQRGRTRESATDVTLLDENVEADGQEYFDLGAFDLAMGRDRIAWSSDTAGDERYTLRIRDLTTGADLADELHEVSNAGVAWSSDDAWLFYVRPDAQDRPSQVWRHRVGAPGADDDVLVHDENDQRFHVAIGTTRSDRWIVIHSASATSSEVRLLATADPLGEPTVVSDRRDDVEYTVDDWGDHLVMLTNDDAVDFRVLAAPATADWTAPEAWVERIPHEAGRRITALDPFAGHLVVHEWAAAQPRLRLLFPDGGERVVDLGTEPHDVGLSTNPEWTSEVVRFATQSMSAPPTIYEEHVGTQERTLLKRTPTPNVDLDAYRSERVWATAADGTRVPLDVVHHRDTPLDGTAPAVLYGYGAYEVSLAPWFSVARLSLLDRGFVFALAHPRGGGELGRQWYLDGKLLAKRNTFTDTLACADHLASVVAGDRIAIRGGSAGGLLVGACVTIRPERFAAAVAEVPFVDVVSSMSDPTLPLTVIEWEEWGDPRAEPYASYIAGYSPYDNTVPVPGFPPPVYITAGLTDPRVSVHEPAKWAARLRDVAAETDGSSPVLLRTEMGAGHGGPSGRYDAWRDEARTLSFILATV